MIARRVLFASIVLLSACAAARSEPPRSPSAMPVEKKAEPSAMPNAATMGVGSDASTTTSAPTTSATPPPTGTAVPGTTSGTTSGTKAPTAEIPTPPTPPVDDVPHAQAKFEESAQLFGSVGTDCTKMCKALASMQRAAEHLCELVKTSPAQEQKRCTDAKARVDHARDKVMSSCGGCD